ncbi:MAG TPA: TolC family protein [Thermoanaerobaculia bacterium]|nr:TolC family protein [Thermoanaerobaculia bacterium]
MRLAVLATFATLSIGLVAPVRAQPAQEPPLTLSQAIDRALTANPGLVGDRLQTEVARAGVAVAGQRPNPELALEETRETPHDAATLSQTIETAGKRRRRIELAEAGVAGREAQLARAINDVRNRVRRAFYTLVFAQRRLAETTDLQHLAERTRDTAKARFESGDVPRLDVLQAELSLAQADNETQSAAGQVAAARVDLNTLLARPPETATTVAEEAGPLPDRLPEGAAAVHRALTANAELAVLDRGIAEQKAHVALTRAQQTPDPVLSGGVTHRSPPEFDWGWRAGLTITLPIFTHRGAAVQVEERTLNQLQAERDARAAEITGAVYSAATTAATRRRELERFRGQILPQAEEVQRMAEDAYRSGQTGLPALLQALQATRDVRLRALQAEADYQASLADLENAMGAPL